MDDVISKLQLLVDDHNKNNIDQQYRGVKTGIFYSGSVFIDGVLYPCEATNENFYADGDSVKCLISDNRSQAVVL